MDPQPHDRAPDRQADRVPSVLPDAGTPEGAPKRRRRGPAVTGAQLQRLTQYAGEIERHSGPVSSSRLALIPATGREGLVDHHPGGVDVAALVRDAGELLRRHVRRRPLQYLRIRLLAGTEAPRDAEVRQHRSVLVEENVRRLYIPMDDTFSMGLAECRQQVAPEFARGVDRQTPLFFELRLKGVALQVIHHVEVQAVPFIDFVDGNDVGVSQIGEDASFVDKLPGGLDGPPLGPQHLDAHETIEGHVPREVDRPHAAACELALELVVRRQGRTQALEEGRHRNLDRRTSRPPSRKSNGPAQAGPFDAARVSPVTGP